jgi:hypothetical protein
LLFTLFKDDGTENQVSTGNLQPRVFRYRSRSQEFELAELGIPRTAFVKTNNSFWFPVPVLRVQHPHRLRRYATWPTIPTEAVGLGTAEKKKFELQSNAFHTVFHPATGYRSFLHELRANRSPALNVREELYLHKAWFELVSIYTTHDMTQTSDRSVAILGLALAIQDGKQHLEYGVVSGAITCFSNYCGSSNQDESRNQPSTGSDLGHGKVLR